MEAENRDREIAPTREQEIGQEEEMEDSKEGGRKSRSGDRSYKRTGNWSREGNGSGKSRSGDRSYKRS